MIRKIFSGIRRFARQTAGGLGLAAVVGLTGCDEKTTVVVEQVPVEPYFATFDAVAPNHVVITDDQERIRAVELSTNIIRTLLPPAQGIQNEINGTLDDKVLITERQGGGTDFVVTNMQTGVRLFDSNTPVDETVTEIVGPVALVQSGSKAFVYQGATNQFADPFPGEASSFTALKGDQTHHLLVTRGAAGETKVHLVDRLTGLVTSPAAYDLSALPTGTLQDDNSNPQALLYALQTGEVVLKKQDGTTATFIPLPGLEGFVDKLSQSGDQAIIEDYDSNAGQTIAYNLFKSDGTKQAIDYSVLPGWTADWQGFVVGTDRVLTQGFGGSNLTVQFYNVNTNAIEVDLLRTVVAGTINTTTVAATYQNRALINVNVDANVGRLAFFDGSTVSEILGTYADVAVQQQSADGRYVTVNARKVDNTFDLVLLDMVGANGNARVLASSAQDNLETALLSDKGNLAVYMTRDASNKRVLNAFYAANSQVKLDLVRGTIIDIKGLDVAGINQILAVKVDHKISTLNLDTLARSPTICYE